MRKWILLGLALIVLAVAFLLVDFRIASSNTTANSNSASIRGGQDNVAPQRMNVYVWIEEKDRLSTQLRDRVMDDLRGSGRFDPTLLPTPKPTLKDYPILRIWIARPGLSWTPVYAQANMQVRYAFSSYSSDVTFEETTKKPLVMNAPPGVYGLKVSGTIEMTDRTFGLISLPAYWDHLSTQAATRLVTDLVATVK